MIPTYGSDTDPPVHQHPYYINIAPNMDATVTPTVTTEKGSLASWSATVCKTLRIRITAVSPRQQGPQRRRYHARPYPERLVARIRSHMAGRGENLSVDGRYLSATLQYRINGYARKSSLCGGISRTQLPGSERILFSGTSHERRSGKHTDRFSQTDYNYVGEPARFGGHWSVDAGLLTLTRTDGTNTRRPLKHEMGAPAHDPTWRGLPVFASLRMDAI